MAGNSAPTTPAQVRPELAGAWQKVQSAITFGWHKQLESFEARALAEEHAALQSQLSNEQLVAQHYKESCDILRERAEAAQQAVAEREARIRELELHARRFAALKAAAMRHGLEASVALEALDYCNSEQFDVAVDKLPSDNLPSTPV